MGSKISALPEATDLAGAALAGIQGGATKQFPATLLGGGAFTNYNGTLAAGEEATVTHPSLTNEQMVVSAWKYISPLGQTNVSLDFDFADEADFVQEDDTKTEFVGGVVQLTGADAELDMTGGTDDSRTAWHKGSITITVSSNASIAENISDFFDGVLGAAPLNSNSNTPLVTTIDFGAPRGIDTIEAASATGWPANQSPACTVDYWNGSAWVEIAELVTFQIGTTTSKLRLTCVDPLQGSGGSGTLAELVINETTYPTGVPYYVTTSDANHLDMADVDEVTSIVVDTPQPTDTTVRWLASFDGRTTWKAWDTGTSAWVTVDLLDVGTDGNTPSDFTDGFAAGIPEGATFLDFAFSLETDVAYATPLITLIEVNYNEKARYDMATVGPYGASTEVGIRRAGPTQTKVKNQTAGVLDCFVNFLTP
jgi:hypothetical protein